MSCRKQMASYTAKNSASFINVNPQHTVVVMLKRSLVKFNLLLLFLICTGTVTEVSVTACM